MPPDEGWRVLGAHLIPVPWEEGTNDPQALLSLIRAVPEITNLKGRYGIR